MKIRAEVPTLQMPFSWLIILPMSSASMLLSPLLVGCSFQAHSLPLSPYTHILDLEVKEAEANAVRRSERPRSTPLLLSLTLPSLVA